MDLAELSAEDVLTEEGLSYYREGMAFFFSQIVELNTDLFFVEQVIDFPIELYFLNRVVQNFLEVSLLRITKLLTDQGDGMYTLRRFKNEIARLARPEFQRQLKRIKYDKDAEIILEKAKKLRNNRIAHHTEMFALKKYEELGEIRLEFVELQKLRDDLNNFYNALSFNVSNMLLPVPYDPMVVWPLQYDKRSDIEKILDSIAKDSTLLNLPETDPARWDRTKTSLSDDYIKRINTYRRKFGLKEV